MLRFSLRTLAVVVTIIALACAALINASPWISSVSLTATILALALATVAAVLTTSGRRGFWIGFAIAGWTFALISMSPLLGRLPASLLTTRILERAARAMPKANETTQITSPPGGYAQAYVPGATYYPPVTTSMPMLADPAPTPPALPPPPAYYTPTVAVRVQNTEFIESFVHIGQAFSVVLLGLVGGLVGLFLATRGDRKGMSSDS